MLEFDRPRSSFLLNGVRIGPGVTEAQLASAFAVKVQLKPGYPRWSFFQMNSRPVSAFVTFRDDKVHSGYFWAYGPSDGLEDYERAEQQRRAEHERLTHALFGAIRFEDQAIRVVLARDPRSGLEQITFELK
jgi:hypothetical protein